jgi:hypothetical protein
VTRLLIERLGGLAGFGLPNSPLKSRGELDLSKLPQAVRQHIEELFNKPPSAEPTSPGPMHPFRYRITRETDSGSQTVEVPFDAVPTIVHESVKDTLD